MEIKTAAKNLFDQLQFVLEQLDQEIYNSPSISLSGVTIGQHVRHALEFFDCLINAAPSGVVNYDNRKRDLSLEQNPQLALAELEKIKKEIISATIHQNLTLELSYHHTDNDLIEVSSCFDRELVYNIEHAIHHMALIKIGLREVAPETDIPDGFGVANSTIRFQNNQHQY
ncbi:MAG: DinB family protein [Cyclobacteriaceae bacterium]